MTDMWIPEIDQMVWFNHPDSPRPLGKVVGFVHCDAGPRAGQPIIETQEDEPGMFGRKKGTQTVTHPMFLLPFPLYGEEWQAAKADGRVRS